MRVVLIKGEGKVIAISIYEREAIEVLRKALKEQLETGIQFKGEKGSYPIDSKPTLKNVMSRIDEVLAVDCCGIFETRI